MSRSLIIMADPLIIERLQKQILALQRSSKPTAELPKKVSLGAIHSAFPDATFPAGAVHEFISGSYESASPTNGFISTIVSQLMEKRGPCVWIGSGRKIYPPALTAFGIAPERIFFVDTYKPKETLWAIEESLKCESVSAVIGEVRDLSFNDSRRLQLAVERSGVTGFIHRFMPRSENAVACVTRWKITPVGSETPYGLPGTGFPRWRVSLVKVRNGKPGEWLVEWSPQGLRYIDDPLGTREKIFTKKIA
jgi:protein ImuA